MAQDTVMIVARKMEHFKYDPAVDSFKGWRLYLTRKQIAPPALGNADSSTPRPHGSRDGDGSPGTPNF